MSSKLEPTSYRSLDRSIEYVKNVKFLNEDDVIRLCDEVRQIFLEESNVPIIQTPCTIVGDIHGQFLDLLEMFEIAGQPPYTNFLFLGDYVDRGRQCVETITLLFLLKVRYPERITLLRGNHECTELSLDYGFYNECVTKYHNANVWAKVTDTFNYLPLAAIVGGRLFCVHGGLSPDVQTIDQIRTLDRFQDLPRDGPMSDLLWSDPEDKDGFSTSVRGAGFFFGPDVSNLFLLRNKMSMIIRAHQVCYKGYQICLLSPSQYQFSNQVLTVWSAPDYCYRMKNIASVLEVDDNLNMFLNTFYKSPYRERTSTEPPQERDQELSQDEKQQITEDPFYQAPLN